MTAEQVCSVTDAILIILAVGRMDGLTWKGGKEELVISAIDEGEELRSPTRTQPCLFVCPLGSIAKKYPRRLMQSRSFFPSSKGRARPAGFRDRKEGSSPDRVSNRLACRMFAFAPIFASSIILL